MKLTDIFRCASMHLYNRLCPSVGPSVRPSVSPSVRPHSAKIAGNKGNFIKSRSIHVKYIIYIHCIGALSVHSSVRQSVGPTIGSFVGPFAGCIVVCLSDLLVIKFPEFYMSSTNRQVKLKPSNYLTVNHFNFQSPYIISISVFFL